MPLITVTRACLRFSNLPYQYTGIHYFFMITTFRINTTTRSVPVYIDIHICLSLCYWSDKCWATSVDYFIFFLPVISILLPFVRHVKTEYEFFYTCMYVNNITIIMLTTNDRYPHWNRWSTFAPWAIPVRYFDRRSTRASGVTYLSNRSYWTKPAPTR